MYALQNSSVSAKNPSPKGFLNASFKSFLRSFTKVKTKRHSKEYRFVLAGEEGFEPSQTESESVVLPLHNSPIN